MRVGIIIQARMGSTRLPGKVMNELCGKTVISHVIERVKQVSNCDEVIVATTVNPIDDVLADELAKQDVMIFRGSEEDVLERYYLAAKQSNLDVVVRITSDCPLIDPFLIEDLINTYKQGDFDLVTNVSLEVSNRTYPRGLDAEVFSFEALENAYKNTNLKYHREHVTPYIYENLTKIFFVKDKDNHSDLRWTLDTPEDFELIEVIYNELYREKHNFYYEDILELIKSRPHLSLINAHIEQKKIK